MRRRKRRTVTQ